MSCTYGRFPSTLACVSGLSVGLLMFVISTSTLATPFPPERPRSPEQTSYLFQMLTWQLGRQGTTIYEGKYEDARPIPKTTLRDFAKIRERELRGSPFDDSPNLRESLYFTFHKTRFRAPEPEVVHIPKQDLWRMVRAGDWVLLSDGDYHHITFVFHVDRQKQQILFLDLWPDEIFLKAGENSLGIDAQVFDYMDFELIDSQGRIRAEAAHAWPAQLDANQVLRYVDAFGSSENKRLVSITRQEYLRVIMGLVTIDTPEFYDVYRQHNEETATRSDVQLSFALTFLKWPGERFRLDLLEWPDEPFIGPALRLSKAALDRVRREPVHELETEAAYIYDMASLIDAYTSLEQDRETARTETLNLLNRLRARFTAPELSASSTPQDYYQLGVAAMRADYLDDAASFFRMAIDADDTYVDAYLSRASVSTRLGGFPQVISDATRALEIASRAKAVSAKRRAERHHRDKWGRQRDDHDLAVADWHRAMAFGIRAGAFGATSRFDDALRDAKALIDLRPDLSKGYGLAGKIEISIGLVQARAASTTAARDNLLAANRYFLQFIEREHDPNVRASVVAELKKSAVPLASATSQDVEFFKAYRGAMVKRNREQALSLVETSPLTARIVAEGLVKQGQKALKRFDVDAAFGAYSIALNLLEQIGDELNVGLVSNDLAVTHLQKGEDHAALAAARRAHIIFEKYNETEAQKASKDTLDRIYGSFPDKGALEAFLREHLRYAREKGFDSEQEMTLKDLQRLQSE